MLLIAISVICLIFLLLVITQGIKNFTRNEIKKIAVVSNIMFRFHRIYYEEIFKILGKLYDSTDNEEFVKIQKQIEFLYQSAYSDIKKKAAANLIHASGNLEEAKQEVALWFAIDDIHSYKVSHEDEVM